MTTWFSQEPFLMRGFAHFVDVVFLNVLILLTSLPVVTVGASLSAGFTAARNSAEGKGKLSRNYFSAFVSNFWKATALWMIYLVSGIVLGWGWLVAGSLLIKALLTLLTAVWFIAFLWTWPLQARFENTVVHTLWNAFYLGVTKIGSTAVLLLFWVVYVALIGLAAYFAPQAIFLLIVLGVGFLVFLSVGVFERAFRPLLGGK